MGNAIVVTNKELGPWAQVVRYDSTAPANSEEPQDVDFYSGGNER